MAKSNGKSGDRQARLAEALRENLRRRKAHVREAESGESDMSGIAEKDSEPAHSERPNPAVKSV